VSFDRNSAWTLIEKVVDIESHHPCHSLIFVILHHAVLGLNQNATKAMALVAKNHAMALA
jgi:hypothetical protein